MRLSKLTFVVAGIATSLPAFAASYGLSIAGSSSAGGGPFSFQAFDASLGQLTNVDFDLTASTAFSFTTPPPGNFSDPPPPSGTATYALKGEYYLYLDGFGAQPFVAESGSGTAPLSFGSFAATASGSGLSGFAITDSEDRDTFAKAAVTGKVLTLLTNYSVQFNGQPASLLQPAVDSSKFQGTVTYTYTPLVGAVPEPATWASLAGGLGLVGAFGGRRRRSPGA